MNNTRLLPPHLLLKLLMLAICSGPVLGQVSTDEEAIQQLELLLTDIQTMSAAVTQLIVESDGGILEESAIQMHLQKPNGFYWETLEPFPELIVTDGDSLWNYQPDLEQVVIEDWDSSRSELAAQLLSGRTESLAQDYSISLVADPSQQHLEFELTPKQTDSVYRQISINFLANELDLIYVNSSNGQQTVWRFDEIRKNPTLSSSIFRFQPPPDVEVIENRYVQ